MTFGVSSVSVCCRSWRRKMDVTTIVFLFLLVASLLSVHASNASTASEASVPNKIEKEANVEDEEKQPNEQTSCAAHNEEGETMDGTCANSNSTTTTTATATTISNPPLLECGLYLAESSIPNAGWGMYTGVTRQPGDVIPPVDVVIPVVDYELHQAFLKHQKRIESTKGPYLPSRGGGLKQHQQPNSHHNHHSSQQDKGVHTNHNNNNNNNNNNNLEPTPKWLMEQYYWDAGMTHNYYDAERIDSVVPGLGMLANSHPGMILAENLGPKRPRILDGWPALGGKGASTPYQDQRFTALHPIPASHEIFVEYGDDWFMERFSESFGLSEDYHVGNVLLEKWQTRLLDQHKNNKNQEEEGSNTNTNSSTQMWKDLRQLILETIQGMNPRLHEVLDRVDFLPDDQNRRLLAIENPTAYASVPNAQRTPEWLQEHGLCLDHITVGNSTVAPGERGAFASRHLPKGTVVAPAPVVHMSRDHLKMLIMDEFDADTIVWQGNQLLLNYVYGHVESSLLFFPYAPAVNVINHYHNNSNSNSNSQSSDSTTNEQQQKRRPNVKLQWSAKMPHPEWLESWKPQDIVQESYKAGMVMEIVAIEEIAEGEEILLDYGNAWQSAYEQHQATTSPPTGFVPVDWENQHQLLTINDKQKYPGHVMTVCWIHEEQRPVALYNRMMETGEDIPEEFIPWIKIDTPFLHDTMPCEIVGSVKNGAFYNVILRDTIVVEEKNHEEEVEINIRNVPRQAITIVAKPYSSAEFRRDAFRHEIQLPEEMVPDHWRDLKPKVVPEEELPQCNLFMAESSIPNAGWGMYRGYANPLLPNNTNEIDHFCHDLVIQVEDFEISQSYRNQFHRQPADKELDKWLLSDYAWGSETTVGGNLEADKVQSIIPGCGMLANSHTVLYNVQQLPPDRSPANLTDASFGATTHYHNSRFVEQFKKIHKIKVRTMQNGAEIFTKGVLPKGAMKEDSEVAKAKLPDRVRSLEWLEENGSCLDNVRPGPSTIDLAGKGLIATRRLREGQVIAPMPMIHIHRNHMEIYSSPVSYEGQRLIQNYCYGHPDSSLLLFPFSPAVNYLNHAPNYTKTGSDAPVANAKLQWSSRFNTDEWLNLSPNEILRSKKQAGLAMELIATREIGPGEEILLDYGDAWSKAWDKHVADWKVPGNWDYEPPTNDWLAWVHTQDEKRKSRKMQYDRKDKFLGCHVDIPNRPLTPPPGAEFPEFEWAYSAMMFRTTRFVHRCEIIERVILDEEDFGYALARKETVAPLNDVYTAIVTVSQTSQGEARQGEQKYLVYNVPRRAIETFDEAYASPQFYHGAFRHEIGTELFPEAWLDLKDKEGS